MAYERATKLLEHVDAGDAREVHVAQHELEALAVAHERERGLARLAQRRRVPARRAHLRDDLAL